MIQRPVSGPSPGAIATTWPEFATWFAISASALEVWNAVAVAVHGSRHSLRYLSRASGRVCRSQSSKPSRHWQNPYVESFNGKVRDELLDVEEFSCLAEARVVIEDWRQDYNQCRPHSSLGMRSPAAFAATPADCRSDRRRRDRNPGAGPQRCRPGAV
jgi:transposase InsO family protein